MAVKFTPPLAKPLADEDAEAVRRSTARAIVEIQAIPCLSGNVLQRVVLPDGSGVQIPHGLGRTPLGYWIGPPTNAATPGVIQDYRSLTPAGNPNDLSQTLSLRAINFGQAITVDIWVF
jgi:hypothetical protein